MDLAGTASVHLLGSELGDELVLGHGRAEHAVRAIGSRLLGLHGGGASAVRQGDDVETLLVCGPEIRYANSVGPAFICSTQNLHQPHGGLDAAVGEESAEGDGVDSLLDEDLLEVGVGEGVEALLALDHDVALLGGHGVADGRVPRPCQVDEDSTNHLYNKRRPFSTV